MHTNVMNGVNSEIAGLRQLFDNTRKGFAEFANKFIKIDYEHILGMDLRFSRRGMPQIDGFHHDIMNAVEKSGLFDFANKVMGKNGFYKADLFHARNFIKDKTFFPAHWSREQVMNKIFEAYDNFVKSGAKWTLESSTKYRIKGLTNDGIKIEMYITQKGKIVTAYPVL